MRAYILTFVVIVSLGFYSYFNTIDSKEDSDKGTVYVTVIDSQETAWYASFLFSSIKTSSPKKPSLRAIIPTALNDQHISRLLDLDVDLTTFEDILRNPGLKLRDTTESLLLATCRHLGYLTDSQLCPLLRILPLGLDSKNIIYLDPNTLILSPLNQLRHRKITQFPFTSATSDADSLDLRLAIYRPEIAHLNEILAAFKKEGLWDTARKQDVQKKDVEQKIQGIISKVLSTTLKEDGKLPFHFSPLSSVYPEHTLNALVPSSNILVSWHEIESGKSKTDVYTEAPSSRNGHGPQNKLDWVWAEIDHRLRDTHQKLLEKQEETDCKVEQKELSKDKYTVMINAFDMDEARRLLLLTHAMHYAGHDLCDQVILVWNNLRTKPPTFEELSKFGPGAEKVLSRAQIFDSLNNRFRPLPEVRTEAVIIADDDIVLPFEDIEFSFSTWQTMPHVIVGSFARSYEVDQHGGYLYIAPANGVYSIVLTKFMILHWKFLHHYTCTMKKNIRAFVDERNNCEDIAMNYIVSYMSSAAPMIVETLPHDFGTTSGISSKNGHMLERHHCVTYFATQFDKGTPLIRTPTKVWRSRPNQVQHIQIHADGSEYSGSMMQQQHVVNFCAVFGTVFMLYLIHRSVMESQKDYAAWVRQNIPWAARS